MTRVYPSHVRFDPKISNFEGPSPRRPLVPENANGSVRPKNSAKASERASERASENRHLTYLHHLDGLRALALFGVLAFHFKLPFFEGGYLGVDAFLVLSGYLMTRNISAAVVDSKFRLTDFYVSRFWRLFPSVAVTILCTLFCASMIYTPEIALDVCKSAIAATFSMSNLYFYSSSGYFDTESNLKPLLHTWSLSLEEQYYLFWPLVLILLSKPIRSRRWDLFAVFSASISLVSFVFTATRDENRSESFDFYLLPARIFEFGAGALIHALNEVYKVRYRSQFSIWESEREIRRLFGLSSMAEIVASLGVALIGYSYVNVASHAHFGLPTVLGTMMVILTPGAKLNRLFLCNAWICWVGKLAYSMYLVHWPVYVFSAYIARAAKLSILENPFFLFTCSLVFGVALNRAVESRYRLKKDASVSSASVAFVLVVSTLTVIIAANGILTAGWAFKFRQEGESKTNIMSRRCKTVSVDAGYHSARLCVVANAALSLKSFKASDSSLLVVGNSHVYPLIGAFVEARDEIDPPILFHFRPGCPLAARAKRSKLAQKCLLSHDQMWQNLQEMPPNATVVIISSYGLYDVEKVHNPFRFVSELVDDVKALGLRPIVFGEAGGVRDNRSFQSCLNLFLALNYWGLGADPDKSRCSTSILPTERSKRGDTEILEGIASMENKIHYISSIQNLCTIEQEGKMERRCPGTVRINGVLERLYRQDGVHLSYYGALAYKDMVKSIIDGSLHKA